MCEQKRMQNVGALPRQQHYNTFVRTLIPTYTIPSPINVGNTVCQQNDFVRDHPPNIPSLVTKQHHTTILE